MGSFSTLDLHHALGMIRLAGDYQAQAGRPSGAGAKVRHGFCGQWDTRFNLDLHAMTEAPKNLAHAVNCVWRIRVDHRIDLVGKSRCKQDRARSQCRRGQARRRCVQARRKWRSLGETMVPEKPVKSEQLRRPTGRHPALVTFDLTGKNSQCRGNGVGGRGVGTGTEGGCTAASECIFLRGETADV